MTAEEEILFIEEILKYTRILFRKMYGFERGGIVKRKESIWKAIEATLTVDS